MATSTLPTPPVQSAPPPATFDPSHRIGPNPISVTTSWGARGLILGDPFLYLPLAPDSPHVTVCSIYSRGDLATRPNTFHMLHNPVFRLPAAPKNGFTCLRVYPGLIPIINFSAIEQDTFNFGSSRDDYENKDVPALVIAQDVVAYTAGHMPLASAGRMLGVGIIQGDIPTQEEFNRLCAQQEAYYRILVSQADDSWNRDRDKERVIGTWHRIALEELGDEDLVRHPWRVPVKVQLMKPCPACARDIPTAAQTCEHCSQDLVIWAVNRWKILGEVPESIEQDSAVSPLVRKAVARLSQAQATAQPAQPAAAKT